MSVLLLGYDPEKRIVGYSWSDSPHAIFTSPPLLEGQGMERRVDEVLAIAVSSKLMTADVAKTYRDQVHEVAKAQGWPWKDRE